MLSWHRQDTDFAPTWHLQSRGPRCFHLPFGCDEDGLRQQSSFCLPQSLLATQRLPLWRTFEVWQVGCTGTVYPVVLATFKEGVIQVADVSYDALLFGLAQEGMVPLSQPAQSTQVHERAATDVGLWTSSCALWQQHAARLSRSTITHDRQVEDGT